MNVHIKAAPNRLTQFSGNQENGISDSSLCIVLHSVRLTLLAVSHWQVRVFEFMNPTLLAYEKLRTEVRYRGISMMSEGGLVVTLAGNHPMAAETKARKPIHSDCTALVSARDELRFCSALKFVSRSYH
jgi:hypothetical protein